MQKKSVLFGKFSDEAIFKDLSKRRNRGEGARFFAVIAECGHCGDGYYIPGLFVRSGYDEAAVREEVSFIPKVKSNKSSCIRGSFEISELEYFFINKLNKCDPYLEHSKSMKDDPEQFDRRNMIEFKAKDLVSKGQDPMEHGLRTAEMFATEHVLERYCAPQINARGQIEYPRGVNKNQFLSEFFTEKTKAIIEKYKPRRDKVDSFKEDRKYLLDILTFYLEVFGLDNPLGIIYQDKVNGTGGDVTFKDKSGVVMTLGLQGLNYEDLTEALKGHKGNPYEEKSKSISGDVSAHDVGWTSGETQKSASRIDKFNQRFGFAQPKKSAQKQTEESLEQQPIEPGE